MQPSTKKPWHSIRIEDVYGALTTRREGLTEEEAAKRLEDYGLNRLKEEKRATPLRLFLSQFKSVLVLILVASAFISGFLAITEGEPLTDSYIIIAILILNSFLGFFQEYRAEKAVEALKAMISPKTIVLRGGIESSIDSSLLVPGDIVLLEAGEKVPADLRVIEEYNLEADEAVLTGESTPVSKISELTEGKNDSNLLYMGSIITSGRGVAVVFDTGMNTRFGGIADLVLSIQPEEAPLKRKVEALGRQLGLISLILCVWVFAVGLLLHQAELGGMLLTSISLAVSAIPEGLPAVLTITLALGVSAMAKQKAIVRRLASVETLGSVTVICTDKTGTITKNEMMATTLSFCDRVVSISGSGFEPVGDFTESRNLVIPSSDTQLGLALRICALCNNSKLVKSDSKWSILGDPTDGGLLILAAKAGITKESLGNPLRITEFPFDSIRKRMSVVYPENSVRIAYIKGAPEELLKDSIQIHRCDRIDTISVDDREYITSLIHSMADNALRVIGLAYKILPDGDDELSIDDVEDKLTFVGLVGMIDSPRPEVNEAIKIANKAGIKVVMATGDYKITAIAIARQVGIIDKVNNNSVLTGEDLDRMSDDELDAVIESVRVFARVSPEHKVKMARAFKRHGHIVAMTGDGVNDAPALKTADIGVAMGINGTDVTKEASDMVLEDDNFATIVKAIEGGRRIYDNITKYIRLMLSANFDEFLMIFVSISLGLPLPFLPIHILWVNLITDGLPAIALSVDPGEGDIMSRKPRDPKEGLLTRYWKFIGVAVALAFTSNFITYYYIYSSTGDESISRSAALTTIVFFELLLAYQVRSESKHVFQWGLKGLTENKLLSVSIGASLLLHLLILYIEPLRGLFKLASLSPTQLGVCIASSCLVFLIVPSWLIKKPQTQFDDEIQVNTKS